MNDIHTDGSRDLDAWVADLRTRVDGIVVDTPPLDDVLARTTTVTPLRTSDGRRRTRAVAGIAAAVVLLAGAVVVLTRDDRHPVSTVEDTVPDPVDPLADLVILAPPGLREIGRATVGGDSVNEDPDDYHGRIDNFIGGSVGGTARVVTVAFAPHGVRSPAYQALGPVTFSMSDWFSERLDGTPVEAAVSGGLAVDGATDARSFSMSIESADGLSSTSVPDQGYIVAQGVDVDVVLLYSGYTVSEAESLVPLLRVGPDDATFDADAAGLTRVPTPRGGSFSPAYTVDGAGLSIDAARLDDAAALIATIHRPRNAGLPTAALTLERGGPDWLLSRGGGAEIAGVRDGMWVRVFSLDNSPPAGSPADLLASLTPLDRSRFEELAKRTQDGHPGDESRAHAASEIERLGSWIPTDLPDGLRLRSVMYNGSSGRPTVPGLPTLWNPTTGATIVFNQRFGPIGIVTDNLRTQRLGIAVYRADARVRLADVWTLDATGPVVTVRSNGVQTADLVSTIETLVYRPDGGWSLPVPDGWEAIEGTDTQKEPVGGISGYVLDLGPVDLTISPDDDPMVFDDIAGGALLIRREIEGRTVYVDEDAEYGTASVFLPATDRLPSIWVLASRRPLDEITRVALSVQHADRTELQEFLRPLGEG